HPVFTPNITPGMRGASRPRHVRRLTMTVSCPTPRLAAVPSVNPVEVTDDGENRQRYPGSTRPRGGAEHDSGANPRPGDRRDAGTGVVAGGGTAPGRRAGHDPC